MESADHGGRVEAAWREGYFFCISSIIFFMRVSISAGGTSSTWVPIDHLFPVGFLDARHAVAPGHVGRGLEGLAAGVDGALEPGVTVGHVEHD